MLFAAGLGTRLRPLTDITPKPLIRLCGKPLIDYNLERLGAFGCERIVINTHHHAAQLSSHVRAHSLSASIVLSHEPVLLETGGGIVQALPLLGEAPFLSLNSDAFCMDGTTPALQRLAQAFDATRMDALLMLVPMARAVAYRGAPDFDLSAEGWLRRGRDARYVFSGYQVLHPRLFHGRTAAPFSLREIYRAAQREDGTLTRMAGLVHDDDWVHVGAADELAEAERYLAARAP